jgi:hypothetical protein
VSQFTSIFNISSDLEFESACFKTFDNQYKNNPLFQQYVDMVGGSKSPKSLNEITFLPIEFFKSQSIKTGKWNTEIAFSSSSTSGQGVSLHHVKHLELYKNSFEQGFKAFYGSPQNFQWLCLLPAYLERQGSSLVYMAQSFIENSVHSGSGFFLNNFEDLATKLKESEEQKIPTILLGVTFGLLDFSEHFAMPLNHTIIMETGGMKGRRKELTRFEVHQLLKKAFKVNKIHSEYGMTELLSQAYSKGNGQFNTPPWMKVMIRDTSDPLSVLKHSKTGGINVIDLANQDSCSFIATQDLGRIQSNNSFEILGRFDNSNVRGCNLLAV